MSKVFTSHIQHHGNHKGTLVLSLATSPLLGRAEKLAAFADSPTSYKVNWQQKVVGHITGTHPNHPGDVCWHIDDRNITFFCNDLVAPVMNSEKLVATSPQADQWHFSSVNGFAKADAAGEVCMCPLEEMLVYVRERMPLVPIYPRGGSELYDEMD